MLYADRYAFLTIVHPDDRERVAATMRDPGPAGYDLEYRIVRPDGSLRWVRTRTFPIHDEHGQVYRYVGIGEDITDRVEAYQLLEQRVAERTRELSTLLEISRQVALTLDLEPLLDLILKQLRAALACDGAAIFKLEEGRPVRSWPTTALCPRNRSSRCSSPWSASPSTARWSLDQLAGDHSRPAVRRTRGAGLYARPPAICSSRSMAASDPGSASRWPWPRIR